MSLFLYTVSSLAGFDPVIFRILCTLDISLVDSVFLQNSFQDLFLEFDSIVVPTQVEKRREELANLNHCAVRFLSRPANLSWYDSSFLHFFSSE